MQELERYKTELDRKVDAKIKQVEGEVARFMEGFAQSVERHGISRDIVKQALQDGLDHAYGRRKKMSKKE